MELKLYGQVEISQILNIKGKIFIATVLDSRDGRKLELTNYASKHIKKLTSNGTVGENAAKTLRNAKTEEWLNEQFECSEPYIGSVLTKLCQVL